MDILLKEKLQRFVKQVPFLYPLAVFALEPGRELRRWKNFYDFRNRCKFLARSAQNIPPHGKLLVVSLLGRFIPAIKQEAFLVKAAELKGLTPYILTSRFSWENRYFKSFGIDHFIYFEDFLPKDETRYLKKVSEDMPAIRSFQDLMRYQYKGVKIGKYVCSSLIRKTYTGTIDVEDSEMREIIKASLVNTMKNTDAAMAIYDEYNPGSALFLERGYTPFGEFFDIALQRNVNVVQWCGCHRDNAYMLKRYHPENTTEHPASLSPQTWEMLKQWKWDERLAAAVQNELYRNYASGEWFSEVGTQFHAKMIAKDEVQKNLGLDPNKKTAVIFSHLFWDGTFFWGEDLFDNYRQWFIETVKAACKNDKLNWVIKLHPANVVKLNRDGYDGELIEMTTIASEISRLPSHVKILPPETKISTYSLFAAMDYCVTVRGTPGIEAAAQGKAVFTAGTGRYDRHGFTVDSASREEYLEKLSKIHTISPLTSEQVELAQKFAFGTFLLRPFHLQNMRISYERDKTASQKVDYLFSTSQDIKNAVDIENFGDWFVNSRNEDYCDMSKLS